MKRSIGIDGRHIFQILYVGCDHRDIDLIKPGRVYKRLVLRLIYREKYRSSK